MADSIKRDDDATLVRAITGRYRQAGFSEDDQYAIFGDMIDLKSGKNLSR